VNLRRSSVSHTPPKRAGQVWQWQIGALPVGVKKTLRFTLRSEKAVAGEYAISSEIVGADSAGKPFRSKAQRLDLTF